MNKFQKKIYYLITNIYYKHRFEHIGKRSVIVSPLQLDETNSIDIDDDVLIADGAWLMGNRHERLTLHIGEHTTIGHFAHIVARRSVTIGKNVLIADRVFISDCTHSYEESSLPIKAQDIVIVGEVNIGDDTWIGENVCVCGHSIGKHCVIGANSVVNKDIPDFSVAVGNPIKVIKQYDSEINLWKRV